MKITVELPDNTVTGFINFVYGDMSGLTIGTIALDGERIKNREATWRTCDGAEQVKEATPCPT